MTSAPSQRMSYRNICARLAISRFAVKDAADAKATCQCNLCSSVCSPSYRASGHGLDDGCAGALGLRFGGRARRSRVGHCAGDQDDCLCWPGTAGQRFGRTPAAQGAVDRCRFDPRQCGAAAALHRRGLAGLCADLCAASGLGQLHPGLSGADPRHPGGRGGLYPSPVLVAPSLRSGKPHQPQPCGSLAVGHQL